MSFKTLSLEIKITCNNISRMQQNITSIKRELRAAIPIEILTTEFFSRQKQTFEYKFDKIKQKNIV